MMGRLDPSDRIPVKFIPIGNDYRIAGTSQTMGVLSMGVLTLATGTQPDQQIQVLPQGTASSSLTVTPNAVFYFTTSEATGTSSGRTAASAMSVTKVYQTQYDGRGNYETSLYAVIPAKVIVLAMYSGTLEYLSPCPPTANQAWKSEIQSSSLR
jgi:hypothetical protein